MSKKQSKQLFLFILFFTVGIAVSSFASLETVRNILLAVLAAYSLMINAPRGRKRVSSQGR